MTPANILSTVVADARKRLKERMAVTSLSQVIEMSMKRTDILDFTSALGKPGMSLIAEVKRASPSKGPLNLSLDPGSLAASYAEAAVDAISVLTEQDWFKGSLQDLAAVRTTVKIPLLRKDFIVDPYQIWEARAWGADAVLLIAAVLNQTELVQLLTIARQANLSVLVEVHDETDLDKALSAGGSIIGINNRDLRDFTVSLDTTVRLRPLIPAETVVVSESGIGRRSDIELLEQVGVDAVLIGETLVRAGDPAAKIKELLG